MLSKKEVKTKNRSCWIMEQNGEFIVIENKKETQNEIDDLLEYFRIGGCGNEIGRD